MGLISTYRCVHHI